MTTDLLSKFSDWCTCGHRTSDHNPLGCSACLDNDEPPCTVDVFTLRREVIRDALEWGFVGGRCAHCYDAGECSYC